MNDLPEKVLLIIGGMYNQFLENKVNFCLEENLFYLLSDCLGFPVQNVGTETHAIGTPNARIFAWAENDGVEIEITVKRKGH